MTNRALAPWQCWPGARGPWVAALLAAGLAGLAAGGAGAAPGPVATPARPLAQAQVDQAVAQIDAHVAELMRRTGVPGVAVAVVQGDRVLLARGFGVRAVGSTEPVDADTVFQLASVSKPIGATVVARQVAAGRVTWATPVQPLVPAFALSDPYAASRTTVGDLYAHRSGLPDHAGDSLEELGFSREEILQRLQHLPLAPFRASYAYTNYGLTAAAMAVASAAGTDWATLSQQTLYQPLGMASTSSRFADFRARANRALGHVKENGAFVRGPERLSTAGSSQRWSDAYNTDRQAPAGGVSSSVNDMARWMSFVLGVLGGKPQASALLPAAALLPAVTQQSITRQASAPGEHTGFYGYGFGVGATRGDRQLLSHSGAFSWGASTYVGMLPAADLGIVVLTNAWPTGLAEAVGAQFFDVAETGAAQRDWYTEVFAPVFADFLKPQGELAGKQPPAAAAPAQPLERYAGSYVSPYHGRVQVAPAAGGGLEMRMGPRGELVYPLRHWDGDLFVFTPINDNKPPGTVSGARFSGARLTLEHYDDPPGAGVFTRAP